ncbi:hypothetical protein HPB50_019978 [Hyalomma asiaticum]|uniref:Uncharacterized protein n=1 Tax=Hyalomma asiaticum TaxID=266040 RepID=A0ACB7SPK9_HYAAI|nr:hypothetical protein HPB50_019978 [Hyalomma asiaticum]
MGGEGRGLVLWRWSHRLFKGNAQLFSPRLIEFWIPISAFHLGTLLVVVFPCSPPPLAVPGSPSSSLRGNPAPCPWTRGPSGRALSVGGSLCSRANRVLHGSLGGSSPATIDPCTFLGAKTTDQVDARLLAWCCELYSNGSLSSLREPPSVRKACLPELASPYPGCSSSFIFSLRYQPLLLFLFPRMATPPRFHGAFAALHGCDEAEYRVSRRPDTVFAGWPLPVVPGWGGNWAEDAADFRDSHSYLFVGLFVFQRRRRFLVFIQRGTLPRRSRRQLLDAVVMTFASAPPVTQRSVAPLLSAAVTTVPGLCFSPDAVAAP